MLCIAPSLVRSPPALAGQAAVDLELVLAIDCSYSVNSGEFELQKRGLARAFESERLLAAVQNGPRGIIAVTVVEWSSWSSQVVAVPWTLVHDSASARRLAATIDSLSRLTAEGATSISAMIETGVALLEANGILGDRKVIDISADGANNNGRSIRLMKLYALMNDVTVNGLAILDEDPALDAYFERRVIAGPDAFVVTANDYNAYLDAILRKLIREIGASPMS